MLLSLTVFAHLFVIHVNRAEYVIDSIKIAGQNITCNQKDDCLVNCVDCNNKIINCVSGYSCSINCEQCEYTIIRAYQVGNVNINCTACRSAQIDVSLYKLDVGFQLNCLYLTSTLKYPGCQYLDGTIVHTEDIYESISIGNLKYNIMINCIGDEVCKQIYIDSTINGNFKAICDGSNACNRGDMIYNPPSNRGQMDLQCLGNDQACYWFHIMSLTARQIYAQCGDGTQKKDNSVCYLLQITGPVHPFDDDIKIYSMNAINNDSVVVECNYDQCQRVEIYVPFGQFQTSYMNYMYDWDNGLYIRWNSCSWDFPAGGWDDPRRDTVDCESSDSIEQIVMHFLKEGANIIVTNKYMYDSRLPYNIYSCGYGKHCIVYSMERNGPSIHINCPSDGVSFCYVMGMQANTLLASTINAQKTRLLLVKGYDKGLEATGALNGATIYAPDKNSVSNGILLLPAGNADNSLTRAIIHAEDSAMTFGFKTFSALVGSVWYVNNSDWVHIDCDYHDMCQDMTVFVDHDSFNIKGNREDIVPSNLCITCSEFYSNGCKGLKLNIKDTMNNVITQFGTIRENGTWYWINNETISIKLEIYTPNGNCSRHTEDILNNTWYWWYTAPSNDNNVDVSNAPKGCDWVKPLNPYNPPLPGYCIVNPVPEMNIQGSFEQKCMNGTLLFIYYTASKNCTGTFQSLSEIAFNCSFGVQCEYATYSFRTYNLSLVPLNKSKCISSAFIGYTRNAVFIDYCDNGKYYTCDENTNSLILMKYNNTVNCSGNPYSTITYNIGECIGDIYVEEIQCNAITTTTANPITTTTDSTTTTKLPTGPTESPSNPPTTSECLPAFFNVTITVSVDTDTAQNIKDTIRDTIFVETIDYLKDIGSTYLLNIFCRGSIFITFEETTDVNTLEVKLFVIQDKNTKLDADKINTDDLQNALQIAINEESGDVISVDVDLEIINEETIATTDDSTFLGLDTGVQYLLIGGLLFIVVLLICAITICCVYKSKNESISKGTNEIHHVPDTSSQIVDNNGEKDKTFPFMMKKTTTDLAMKGVDLQKRNNDNIINANTNKVINNSVMVQQQQQQQQEMIQLVEPISMPPIPPPIPPIPAEDEGGEGPTPGIDDDYSDESENDDMYNGQTANYQQ